MEEEVQKEFSRLEKPGEEMLEERSAGAIIVRHTPEGPKYLLLHYPAGHWDFPKGNIEKGEEEVETVKREVAEETGIDDIRLLYGFREKIEYYYRKSDELVRKEVVFYLAETERSEVRLSYEHKDYSWLGYEEALKRLTFSNAKKLLRTAHSFLKEKEASKTKSLDEFS